jgi:hypothetical protein
MRDYRACRLRLGERGYQIGSMSSENLAQPILAVVRDLMFASKISASAKSSGICIKLIRDPKLLPNEPGTRVIVDLNQPGTIEAAVQWKASHSGPVIGFVSHVDTEMIARAKAAGIDQIMSRGQFAQNIEKILSDWGRCVDPDKLA